MSKHPSCHWLSLLLGRHTRCPRCLCKCLILQRGSAPRCTMYVLASSTISLKHPRVIRHRYQGWLTGMLDETSLYAGCSAGPTNGVPLANAALDLLSACASRSIARGGYILHILWNVCLCVKCGLLLQVREATRYLIDVRLLQAIQVCGPLERAQGKVYCLCQFKRCQYTLGDLNVTLMPLNTAQGDLNVGKKLVKFFSFTLKTVFTAMTHLTRCINSWVNTLSGPSLAPGEMEYCTQVSEATQSAPRRNTYPYCTPRTPSSVAG